MARTVNHEQHRQRREAITAAATGLFARHGFAETTTAQIAREAGISAGNLFYYFPDKPAIFRAIFEHDIPASRDLFAAHAEPADPVAAILDVVSTLGAPARDELAPGLLVELLRRAGDDPQLMQVVAANEAIVHDGLATLVRQAATSGSADPTLDPHLAAVWIRTIIDAAFLNAGHDDSPDPVPMLRLITARFLDVPGAAPAHDDPNSRESS